MRYELRTNLRSFFIFHDQMSGIYIHFPFCTKKCIYCNFYSTTSLSQKEAYIKALQKEIIQSADYLSHAPIQTLFFGGGTPSLLSAQDLSIILETLKRHYFFDKNLEFTFEANPETLTLEYLKSLRKLGVNRMSIGIQSFHDSILHFLNRRHNGEEAKKAINNALRAGFKNISIDLIYGISERTGSMWLSDLQTAYSYPITHLSAYALSIEENTLLQTKIKRGILTQLREEQFIEDYYLLLEESRKAGFEQYEISNFAKNKRISKHNYAYWEGKPYLGLGPSAHSYNLQTRRWNVANNNTYIQQIEIGVCHYETETLSETDHFNEYILLHLRTAEGIDIDKIRARFGDEKELYVRNYFQTLEPSHYIIDNNYYQLTDTGKLFADQIAMNLFILQEDKL